MNNSRKSSTTLSHPFLPKKQSIIHVDDTFFFSSIIETMLFMMHSTEEYKKIDLGRFSEIVSSKNLEDEICHKDQRNQQQLQVVQQQSSMTSSSSASSSELHAVTDIFNHYPNVYKMLHFLSLNLIIIDSEKPDGLIYVSNDYNRSNNFIIIHKFTSHNNWVSENSSSMHKKIQEFYYPCYRGDSEETDNSHEFCDQHNSLIENDRYYFTYNMIDKIIFYPNGNIRKYRRHLILKKLQEEALKFNITLYKSINDDSEITMNNNSDEDGEENADECNEGESTNHKKDKLHLLEEIYFKNKYLPNLEAYFN